MEILSTSSTYEIWFIMLPTMIISFLVGVGAYQGYEKKNKFQLVALSLVSILIFVGLIIYCSNEAGKKQLKVIITDMDEVNFDKYFIMENEGKIITLREK
jgi:hypothetical protein